MDSNFQCPRLFHNLFNKLFGTSLRSNHLKIDEAHTKACHPFSLTVNFTHDDNLLSWCDQAFVNIFKKMGCLSSCAFFNLDLAAVSRSARWICCQGSAPPLKTFFFDNFYYKLLLIDVSWWVNVTGWVEYSYSDKSKEPLWMWREQACLVGDHRCNG